MESNTEHQPVKLTITYADGRTKDFEIFIAVVAEGLIVTGESEGVVLYSAAEDFHCLLVASVAADYPVVSELLKGMQGTVKKMLMGMEPLMALKIVSGLIEQKDLKGEEPYYECRTARKNAESN
ncbi:hypothetical protein LCGC14_0591190 [marine sediment metagenome]|uniref:Uncharacterized protein n=1 Tax=marine sediment metagenome TaxID=412755 RepID=A0A0F9RX63_9ZZZZ